MEKQLMVRISRVPGSCPYCGGKNFIVYHRQIDLYHINLTQITDNVELLDEALGICSNCSRQLNFLPTPYGFYPMSKLGTIINDRSYIPHDKDLDKKLDNPMKLTEE